MKQSESGKFLFAAGLVFSSLLFIHSASAENYAVSATLEDIWNDASGSCLTDGSYDYHRCATKSDFVIMTNGKYLTSTGDDDPLRLESDFTACARWKFIRATDVHWDASTPYTHLIYQDASSGCADDRYLQVWPDAKGLAGSNVMPLVELLYIDTDRWQIMKKGTTTIVTREPVECPDIWNEILCKAGRHTMYKIPANYALGPCCVQVHYEQEDHQTYLTSSGDTASNSTDSPFDWAVKRVQDTPPARIEGYIYHESRKCMQAASNPLSNGDDIHLWDSCDSGSPTENREWFYESSTKYIRNLQDPSYCMHKQDGGWANGNNIHMWKCDDGSAENKTWDYTTNLGFGEFKAAQNSGKCIDLWGGNTANGSNIQLYDCNGSTSQKWRVSWY